MPSQLRSILAVPFWVFLASFGALFLRFGYNFGAGDQDEVIPLLLSMLDPTLFRADWFVQLQSAEIGVRTYVVWLLLPLCKIAPITLVVFLLYMTCWMLVGSGTYRIARRLLNDRVGAAISVFLTLGVLHKWTLGSNDLVYSMFVGEMVAWSFALYGLDLWFARRDRKAALLFGIATWFQLLVGLLLMGVLVVERLWDRTGSHPARSKIGNDFLSLGIFILAALPAIVPIALQQLDALAVDSDLVFYILAPFRNPFHHMFLSFGTKAIIRFIVLLALGTAGFVYLARRGVLSETLRLRRMIVVIMVFCGITIIFTEVWPILLIAKFQAFKLTVVLKFLLLIGVSGALSRSLPDRFVSFVDRFLTPGWLSRTLSLAAVAVVVVLVFGKPELVAGRLLHDVHAASDLGRIERWIRDETNPDAIFAVPPDNSTFRSHARRAIIVNYAAFPFDDVDMIAWYRRLMDVAPIARPETGLGIKPLLNRAFFSLEVADWRALANRYNVQFLLTDENELQSSPPFDVVHKEGRWVLYRLPRE